MMFLFTFLLCLNHSENITNSETLIQAMYDKYHNNYNKNITFIQKNIEYLENGDKEISVLYEAHHYPGNYRVDYGYIPNKNGYIFSKDSLYKFKDSKLENIQYSEHNVILLTGDIFYLAPKSTTKKLSENGFNLSKFRLDTFEGNKVYVIGSESAEDTISPQFWIDANNLYLVRLIDTNELTHTVEDCHFIEHEKVGDAWVEDKVLIFANGRLIREETYTEVKPNNELDPSIFNPKFWGKVHWHKK